MEGTERTLEDAVASLREEVASLRTRLDEVGSAVGRFGTTLVDRLTAALDRAREEAPDVDELVSQLTTQVRTALAEARDDGSIDEMRRTLESELGKLKEQVAYGMAALLRQVDQLRPQTGPNAPSHMDRRRSESHGSAPPRD